MVRAPILLMELRQEFREFYNRQMGGGSVRVWGAFSYAGKCYLQKVDGKMNSVNYRRMSYGSPSSFIYEYRNGSSNKIIFSVMHPNPQKTGLKNKSLMIYSWPSHSSVLSLIGNLWTLSRQVYRNNKQYHPAYELELAIMEKWDHIPEFLLKNLINSMPNRLFKLIQINGGATSCEMS